MSGRMDIDREVERLMAEVRENQSRLEEVQRGLLATELVGSAERGLVTATMTGGGRFTAVTIEDDAVRQFPPTVLGEVVLAALNDAMRQHVALTRERFGPYLEDPAVLDDVSAYYEPEDPQRQHHRR